MTRNPVRGINNDALSSRRYKQEGTVNNSNVKAPFSVLLKCNARGWSLSFRAVNVS